MNGSNLDVKVEISLVVIGHWSPTVSLYEWSLVTRPAQFNNNSLRGKARQSRVAETRRRVNGRPARAETGLSILSQIFHQLHYRYLPSPGYHTQLARLL